MSLWWCCSWEHCLRQFARVATKGRNIYGSDHCCWLSCEIVLSLFFLINSFIRSQFQASKSCQSYSSSQLFSSSERCRLGIRFKDFIRLWDHWFATLRFWCLRPHCCFSRFLIPLLLLHLVAFLTSWTPFAHKISTDSPFHLLWLPFHALILNF